MSIKCSTKDVFDSKDVPTTLSLDPAHLYLGASLASEQPAVVGDLIDREVEALEVRGHHLSWTKWSIASPLGICATWP